MSDPWEDMRKAKEEQYFKQRNQEALRRMADKTRDSAHEREAPRRPILSWLRRTLGSLLGGPRE